MTTMHRIDGAPAQDAGAYAGPAWLALGFRPFYLLACAFAAASVPLWLASFLGHGPASIGLAWHMHEMVFGFVLAVVIGFLYTAARNWTGLWTPRGAHLAAIAALWMAGRIGMATGPSPWAALLDLLFIPVAAWPLYRVLERSGNRRNMVMIALLALLTIANLAFHASAGGMLALAPSQPVHAAIMLIVVMEAILGGRVIPLFTGNTLGVKAAPLPALERSCMVLTVLAGLAWALALPAWASAPLALGAAAAQAGRLALWKPWTTLRHPLLWVLHLSYAWIPVGFLLLALAELALVPVSAAVHTLAVGAMGGLIVGMITRTALGHTGRALQAGRADVAMYVLIQLGAMARVAASLLPADLYSLLLHAATLCWSATFLLYLAVYGPRLWRARADGREG